MSRYWMQRVPSLGDLSVVHRDLPRDKATIPPKITASCWLQELSLQSDRALYVGFRCRPNARTADLRHRAAGHSLAAFTIHETEKMCVSM